MSLPSFVHGFPAHWGHGWEYEEAHSVQTGLHIEIDFILDNLQHRPMWKLRKYPAIQKKLRALISFAWGLNCGFPILDVIKFVIWEHQGCPTISKHKETDMRKIILILSYLAILVSGVLLVLVDPLLSVSKEDRDDQNGG